MPTVSNDFLADVGLPSSRSAAGRAGFVTAAALPIRLGGEIIGVLKLYAHEPEAFGPQELDTRRRWSETSRSALTAHATGHCVTVSRR